MKKSYWWILTVVLIALFVFTPDVAMAAPGGKIVSGLFKTTWGKILLGVLTILFLPFIIFVMIKEKMAERRTRQQLAVLAAMDRNFDWLTLKDRATECHQRVNAAWSTQDMGEASEWMTSWYWQNQQLAYLNQWERDGLINHCRIKSITSIRPLYFQFNQHENGTADDSRVVLSITADMEDYLAERATGKVVEGKPGYASTEHLWTFVLKNGKWLVQNIEEGAMSLTYAGMKSELPQNIVLPGRANAQQA